MGSNRRRSKAEIYVLDRRVQHHVREIKLPTRLTAGRLKSGSWYSVKGWLLRELDIWDHTDRVGKLAELLRVEPYQVNALERICETFESSNDRVRTLKLWLKSAPRRA